MFKTILLAYDGSDHAQNALKTAAEVAKAFGAVLHVAHTPEVDTPPVVVEAFVDPVSRPPTDEEIAEAGQKIVAEAQHKAELIGVRIAQAHVGWGDPADFVLKTAKQIDADLIVMGRRGLGSLRALAFGSVSQSIAHHAKVPCLTVV